MIRKKLIIQPLIIMLIQIVSASDGYSSPGQLNSYFITAARKAKSSVVMITVLKKKRTKQSAVFEKVAYGSGTCIMEQHFVVTNLHVLQKGDFYHLTHGGIKYTLRPFSNGSLYLSDEKTDIALLRIEPAAESGLVPITVRDSESISEGEWVIAIGNPFGLNQSISGGIISSKGRDNIGFSDIEDFIQSDVPINPGNSGGPLVNLSGEMVGLNTAIRTDSGGSQGISFSIPSNIVKQVCSDLINHGRVRRGWLGFIVKEHSVDGGAPQNRIEIISVIKNSPASDAGLLKGDIVREIDGIQVYSIGMLLKHVGTKKIGSKVSLTISRDGILSNVKLSLHEKQEFKKIKSGLHELYSRYGVEIDENADTDEIVITRVSPWSPGYGLREGDAILSINGKKITSLEEFIKTYQINKNRINSIRVRREHQLYEFFSFEE